MKTCNRHLKTVVETGLCTGCGVCAGVCPRNVIVMQNGKASCRQEETCMDCGWCQEVCPSYGYPLNDLYKYHYQLYEASSTNTEITRKSSSGGVITQMLHNAMAGKYVDAVVVVQGCESIEEGLCRYTMINHVEDISKSSGSKYVMASLDQILIKLKQIHKRVAMVALPCQMYGITKAMDYDPMLKNNIVLKIGLFCGYTYSNDCVKGLAAMTGMDRVKRIVGWREEGLPGFCVLENEDGKMAKISFIEEHSVDVPFYAYEKCLLCKDCFADYADIVAGDIGRSWKDKKTLVLVRSQIGVEWFEMLQKDMKIKKLCAGDWRATPIAFLELQKRSKVSERIQIRQREKKNIPVWTGDYNERKLMFIQKMNIKTLIKKQDRARKQIDQYLKSPAKMLRVGKQLYYKGENVFWVKYAGIAEKVLQIAFRTNWMNIVRNSMPQKKRLFRSEEKYINVGVIGLGSWGRQYVPILQKWGGFHLLCVYDQNRAVCDKIAKKYRVAVQTPEEMAVDDQIDTIFILTPNHMHYEQILLAMEHKKNVFVEKPLVNEYALAKKLQKMSIEKHLYLYVAHSMKMGKGFYILKQLIQNGELGEIRQFSCIRSIQGINPSMRASWRADAKKAPLLPMIQLGIHLLDASLYLFGEEASCNSAVAHEMCGLIESITCMVTIKNVTGSFIVSYDAPNTMEYVVYGTKGRAVLNDRELLLFQNGNKKVLARKLDKEELLLKEIKDYYSWRMGEKEAINTLNRAVKVIKIFDEIRSMVEMERAEHGIKQTESVKN